MPWLTRSLGGECPQKDVPIPRGLDRSLNPISVAHTKIALSLFGLIVVRNYSSFSLKDAFRFPLQFCNSIDPKTFFRPFWLVTIDKRLSPVIKSLWILTRYTNRFCGRAVLQGG